ncbi:helix-turn-helix transcriptional regulator [Nocardioides sp. T2.26MG-1]|uniref:helix-turn-helix transcriptional regulator n=1 Tax=Nocardioides sp. T2.26MG-1 TaxID=3041166 RepID=UPI0024774F99|nr:WYL domain-containing protein [Nocardioides sp. T2.26MG-1]CAI9406455.1 hypothetical protein HIDPHFAB_04586 [Nocardioides sp. T2.26MG-1]
MRADRLLQLLHLLQRHGRLPARRLAELLEVSERTVLRDMEALSAAGVPVYLQRGRGGGCALVEGYRTDVSGLSTAEAQALFVWGGRDSADALGLGPALATGMAKLAATVPSAALNKADELASVLVVDRRRWFAAAEEVPVLPVLRQAATDGRRVRLRYTSAGSEGPAVRTVDPYGLVENAGRWYLLGAHRGGARMFRVSRIASAEILADAATRPADLDLAAEWARLRGRLETGEAVAVDVAVVADEVELFRRLASFQVLPDSVIEDLGVEDRTGRVLLRLTMRARRQAIGLLLTFAGAAELLAPADLRADLVERAAAALRRHGALTGTG